MDAHAAGRWPPRFRSRRRRPPPSRGLAAAHRRILPYADPRSPHPHRLVSTVKVSTPASYMSIWKKLATSAKYVDTEGALEEAERAGAGPPDEGAASPEDYDTDGIIVDCACGRSKLSPNSQVPTGACTCRLAPATVCLPWPRNAVSGVQGADTGHGGQLLPLPR